MKMIWLFPTSFSLSDERGGRKVTAQIQVPAHAVRAASAAAAAEVRDMRRVRPPQTAAPAQELPLPRGKGRGEGEYVVRVCVNLSNPAPLKDSPAF